MSKADADRLASWLTKASAGVQYGSVSLTLTIHGGEIRLIEKTINEKEKPDEERNP